MKTTLKIILLAFATMLFISCEKDDVLIQEPQTKKDLQLVDMAKYEQYCSGSGGSASWIIWQISPGVYYEVSTWYNAQTGQYDTFNGYVDYATVQDVCNGSMDDSSYYLGKLDRFVLCQNPGQWVYVENGQHYQSTWYHFINSEGEIEMSTPKITKITQDQAEEDCGLSSGTAKEDSSICIVEKEDGYHYEYHYNINCECYMRYQYDYHNNYTGISAEISAFTYYAACYGLFGRELQMLEDMYGKSSTCSLESDGATHVVANNNGSYSYEIIAENGNVIYYQSIDSFSYSAWCAQFAIRNFFGIEAKEDMTLKDHIALKNELAANMPFNNAKAFTCTSGHSGSCSSECDGIVKVGCTCCSAEFYNNKHCPNGHYWQNCQEDELG